jgi:hypothetical protein
MKSIMARLRHLGVELHRRNVAAMRRADANGKVRLVRCGRPGQADLWGTDNTLGWARHWEIEVKRAGEVPTFDQTLWLKLCHSRGCIAYWADNANTAEAVAIAVLQGGRIVWSDTYDYDVEMST